MLPGDAMDCFGLNTINGSTRFSARAVMKMSHTASLLTADVTTNEIVNTRNLCYVIIDKSRMSLKTAADEVVHRWFTSALAIYIA